MDKRDIDPSEPDSQPAGPSKSQRKREAHDIRDLANLLIGLPAAQLGRIPLDDRLRAAVDEARAIRSHIARKRQMQFVAKLLRNEDTGPIIDTINAIRGEARQLTARHHRAEAWRDHLIDAGDEAVSELVSARPEIDVPAIRRLVRTAAREAREDKPPAAARTLFRHLRDLDEIQPLPHRNTG